MLLVGFDDLQALDQSITDGRVLHDPAKIVELGFGVQRGDRPLETFAVIGRAEIIKASGGAGTVFEIVSGKTHR
jgi:hypothetical protein